MLSRDLPAAAMPRFINNWAIPPFSLRGGLQLQQSLQPRFLGRIQPQKGIIVYCSDLPNDYGRPVFSCIYHPKIASFIVNIFPLTSICGCIYWNAYHLEENGPKRG